ncbi:EAL domain-containing protein [Rhodopseudomonas sp. BR0G17]|uniref:sensor domain-containing phosphodiesterase n=1 Tax=Rhodopseudomonas sp. BR0G17 TaxID=2269368 RepID=UPI0013E0536C|nr:EAL domain-containing protein [Rhodopseudomonas sp. BR0G17]
MSFPVLPDETTRLAALRTLQILDTAPTLDFDSLVRLACDLLEVPIAAVSFVDEHRQWFKSVEGLACRQTPRDQAFCAYTICSAEPLIVPDATEDERFRDNALVTGAPNILFYAGVPLQIAGGPRVGSLCLMDMKPRTMTELELTRLKHLRDVAVGLLSNHARSMQASQHEKTIREQEQLLWKNNRLLESACEIGKLGAWEYDVATGELRWTRGMFSLHEMAAGTECNVAEQFGLYPEPERSRLAALVSEADLARRPFRFEGRMYTAKGNLKWMRLVSEVELDGDRLVRRYGLKQDITEEKLLLERVRQLANSDDLTGLGNRRAARRTLVQLGRSPRTRITLLALDLDGFKEINDTHGHAAGDACLRRIGRRLRCVAGPEVVVARTGGDEFSLIWTGTDEATPERLIEGVLKSVREPISWRGHSFHLSCSIGVATRQDSCCFVPDDLFHEADLALYEAKRDGKNCWRRFRDELQAATMERKAVLTSAKKGLSEDRFRLFFQPKVLLANRAHSGFEALLRLVGEDGSVLTPGSLSAALEDPSLSRSLGDFVVEAAFQQARAWSDAGVEFGHIAINLSASQLRSPGFSRHFLDRLDAYRLPPRLISVEVTENVLLSSHTDDITANCLVLKEGSISIAFDDFGTGYASLTHLRDLPVDTIKIDRSFIAGLNDGACSLAIVNAIVGLGNNLGLDVVAEGVETQPQQEYLAAIGCQFAQGFLFGKPMPAEDAERLLIRSPKSVDEAA